MGGLNEKRYTVPDIINYCKNLLTNPKNIF